MESIDAQLKLITDLIVKNVSSINNPGLFTGKMGICMYLFYMGRLKNDQTCIDLAETLVDQIFKNIGQTNINTSFDNGLAGIAWSMQHLIRHQYLNRDPDEMFAQLDDEIFKFLTTQNEIPINIRDGLLGYGFYLVSRLTGKDLSMALDHNFLLKRLLITVINKLYTAVDNNEELLGEPERFRMTWNLPIILIFLSDVRALNIYNHKVDIILNRLASTVTSIYPKKYGNRLFLILSLEKLLRQEDLPKWNDHLRLLKEAVQTDKILDQFPNKNIQLIHGLAGLNLILKLYQNTADLYEFDQLRAKIIETITESDFWVDIEKEEKLHPGVIGLFAGFAGIGISLLDNIPYEKW